MKSFSPMTPEEKRARRRERNRAAYARHPEKFRALARVICPCGAVREIPPQSLARLVGWKLTLKELAPRMRCSRCGKKAAEVVAVARPRPRGVPKNPH
jgi:hypothetical protein